MAMFVLVHGAWGGGWVWKKVVPLLRAAGHDVHAATASGLDDRVHFAGPDRRTTTVTLTDAGEELAAWANAARAAVLGPLSAGWMQRVERSWTGWRQRVGVLEARSWWDPLDLPVVGQQRPWPRCRRLPSWP